MQMIRERRPSGTNAARAFARRFLGPIFGSPDSHGNYVLTVGKSPKVMFAAHYDTMHVMGGTQKVIVKNGFARLPDNSPSNCLGADCTAGIWLILRMIRAGVPGVYAVFADEEIGAKGASAFVRDNPEMIARLGAVISLDRKGYSEIITHQMGGRTASDAFAWSLADILGMDHEPSDKGVFTDSAMFAEDVPECCNLSVGYFNQHTIGEVQDLDYLAKLADRLIRADWSRLVIERDPSIREPKDFWGLGASVYGIGSKKSRNSGRSTFLEPDSIWSPQEDLSLSEIVSCYPDAVARFLRDCGFSAEDLQEYISDFDLRSRWN
jgi:hypothetical protein